MNVKELLDLLKRKDCIKPSEIYLPGEPSADRNPGYFVPRIELTREQAWAEGWHYRRKSKGKLRITCYSGSDREAVVPYSIDGNVVNEIGSLAFYGTSADIVFLPDSVRTLGEECFAESSIRRAILPDGITDLPEKCFFSCKRLESVRVSGALRSIGSRAFMYCENLRFFSIPETVYSIGTEVFRFSGLTDFAMDKRKIFYTSANSQIKIGGDSLCDTPLHRKCEFIAAPDTSDFYYVLLVGSMKTVRFPEGSTVLFRKGSIQHGCTLDLSKCRSVEFEYNAYASKRTPQGIISSHVMSTVILPFGAKVCIPYYVNAYYPDGSKYTDRSWFTDISIKNGCADMIPMERQLKPYCFNGSDFGDTPVTELKIGMDDEYWLLYEENAIHSYKLKSVTFRQRLSGFGRLFTDQCFALEKVTMKMGISQEYRTVYIPVYDYDVHKYLLSAFAGDFDSSVYDRVFTQLPKNWGAPHRKRLSQKTLIVIAADVLRSSPALFPNRGMYEKYLRTHKRYAQLVMDKLPLGCSQFLMDFYAEKNSSNARRGFMPTDERDFGEKYLPLLRKAAEEVYYLLNRGYSVTPATRFIGDHYQLSERQRLALARTVSPECSITARKSREVTDINGGTLYIDGFNVLIGLEIAFSNSMLFRCMDGTVRDLAGLHGTYRLIPQTDLAIRAVAEALTVLKVSRAVICLDKPVSNSGRLKQRIYELANDVPFELEVLTEDAVDSILKTKPLIASADAIILDECGKWFNLNRYIVDKLISNYPYVDITGRGQ